MKNVLSNKKVVQMLMFALRKKIWKNSHKSVFGYRFNLNKYIHMFLFVTQGFWVFIVRICSFFVCAPDLFEITEWQPCMWLLNTDILAGNAARQ